MLQDIKVSDQLVAQYEETVAAPQRAAAEAAGGGAEIAQLSFRILNERAWPSYRTPEPLLFPPELSQCLDQLGQFYDDVRASSGGSGGSQTVVRWVTDKCKAEIVPNYGRYQRATNFSVRAFFRVVDRFKAKFSFSCQHGMCSPHFYIHSAVCSFKSSKTRPLRMEVNAYQAAILLLFNRAGVDPEAGLTLTEIASSTYHFLFEGSRVEIIG